MCGVWIWATVFTEDACFISFEITWWICARVAEGWVVFVATAWDWFVISRGDRGLFSGRGGIVRGRNEQRQREANSPVNGIFSLSLSTIAFIYHSFTFQLQFYDDTLLVPYVWAVIAHSRLLGLFSYLSIISYANPFKPFFTFLWGAAGYLPPDQVVVSVPFPNTWTKLVRLLRFVQKKLIPSVYSYTLLHFDSAIISKVTAISPPGSEVKRHHGPSLANS